MLDCFDDQCASLASEGAVVSDVSQIEGARNTTVIYLDFYISRRTILCLNVILVHKSVFSWVYPLQSER